MGRPRKSEVGNGRTDRHTATFLDAFASSRPFSRGDSAEAKRPSRWCAPGAGRGARDPDPTGSEDGEQGRRQSGRAPDTHPSFWAAQCPLRDRHPVPSARPLRGPATCSDIRIYEGEPRTVEPGSSDESGPCGAHFFPLPGARGQPLGPGASTPAAGQGSPLLGFHQGPRWELGTGQPVGTDGVMASRAGRAWGRPAGWPVWGSCSPNAPVGQRQRGAPPPST